MKFEQLLQKEFKPKTEEAKSAVNNAVATLAQQALQNAITISDDTYQTIEAIIAEIDRKLSEQINLILHHEDFQKLEGEWRGLHHWLPIPNRYFVENQSIAHLQKRSCPQLKTLQRYRLGSKPPIQTHL